MTQPENAYPLELPALDNMASIQHAISQVVNALATGALDTPRARTILYGLQIASSNMRANASSRRPGKQKVKTARTGATRPEPAAIAPPEADEIKDAADGATQEKATSGNTPEAGSYVAGSYLIDTPQFEPLQPEPLQPGTPSPSVSIAEPGSVSSPPAHVAAAYRNPPYESMQTLRQEKYRQMGIRV